MGLLYRVLAGGEPVTEALGGEVRYWRGSGGNVRAFLPRQLVKKDGGQEGESDG